MTDDRTEARVTLREVASSIDWLSSDDDRFDFDSADWSGVDDDGSIVVEGYAELDDGRHYIRALFTLNEVVTSYCPDNEDEDPDA